jgi:hypothetical protein
VQPLSVLALAAASWIPPHCENAGVTSNTVGLGPVPDAESVPLTMMETPPSIRTVVPGWIVRVTPTGIVNVDPDDGWIQYSLSGGDPVGPHVAFAPSVGGVIT